MATKVFLVSLICFCLLDTSTALAAKDGLDGPPPCDRDGICNIAACNRDPDCPVLDDDEIPSTAKPREWVQTPCGGQLWVEATDSPIGVAASRIRPRYPSFNAAQKARDPSFFDAHPSGAMATGHGELDGFGVTMVQGKWPNPVGDATGDLDDPTLLFFQKNNKGQDFWSLIGLGYTFALDRDGEARPTLPSAVPASKWIIHEAGYHHSPGDGGFTCATNDDLRKTAFNAGKRIDAAGCFGITKSDLKTREFSADVKHGRFWTVHVWLEPETGRPAYAETDPWCRQSDSARSLPQCAFISRGFCP